MNLPNIISIVRALLLPLILYLLVHSTSFGPVLPLLVFLLAVFTDFIDGYLARKQRALSRVGSFLDPFADKVLIGGLLLYFVLEGQYWASVVVAFILRDIVVAVIRWRASRDDITIKNWFYTKLLVALQYGIIVGLLLERQSLDVLQGMGSMSVLLCTGSSLLLAFVSVVHYLSVYGLGIHKVLREGRKIGKEKMIVLANKKSRGYKQRYRRHLLKIFGKRRQADIVYLPFPAENFFRGVQRKIQSAHHVIIAGGDGTFDAALNYSPFQRKSLGFFPLGAGNAYYSYFYKGKRFEYLRSRFPFREVPMDILEVEMERRKVLTMITSLGFDSEVIRMSSSTRTKHGFFDYVRGTVRAILTAKSGYDLQMEVDGKKIMLKNCLSLELGKVPYGGFAMRYIVGKVLPADGKVYATACVNAHSSVFNILVRSWGQVLSLFNVPKSPLVPLAGKSFMIKSEVPFPVQAGGEFLGYSTWMKVRVKRQQNVLMI